MTDKTRVFWAIWQDKQDFPDLYQTKAFAVETIKKRARQNPGIKIHLMKIESIGTMLLPDKLKIDGEIEILNEISEDVVK